MSRVYNFSAGPAVLPEEVLKEAAAEMMDYQGTGMSVMEMSHRSKAFQGIIDEAEKDLRELMNIPDNYKVLFLQGGASQQSFTVRQMRLLPVRIRRSATSRTARIFRLMIMRTMFISARIIRFTERFIMNFPILRGKLWLRIFLPVSYRNRLM